MTETGEILEAILGPVTTTAVEPISGRGVFSVIERCHLSGPGAPAATVVVKRPTTGANHIAARDGGAYRREALAYDALAHIVDGLGPRCFGTVARPDGGIAFVLEDLEGGARITDQVLGLTPEDTLAVVDTLARWHDRAVVLDLDALEVRRDTPARLPLDAAARGLEHIDAELRPVFTRLLDDVDRHLAMFSAAPGLTLCHGDPRGDNVAIVEPREAMGGPVAPARLFDFQQLAVQTFGADLAWLLATSLEPAVRRSEHGRIVAHYAEVRGLAVAEVDHAVHAGALLPGLAVLLLVQRDVDDERGRAMVAASVRRIAAMVTDLL